MLEARDDRLPEIVTTKTASWTTSVKRKLPMKARVRNVRGNDIKNVAPERIRPPIRKIADSIAGVIGKLILVLKEVVVDRILREPEAVWPPSTQPGGLGLRIPPSWGWLVKPLAAFNNQLDTSGKKGDLRTRFPMDVILRFLILSLCLFGAVPSAWTQIKIPLELTTIGTAQRLVIHVGINGSDPLPYLFDTGSPGFNAIYYDQLESSPSNWTYNSVISSNATVAYGTGGDPLVYTLNAVTVNAIQIYHPTGALPPVTLTAPGGSGGYTIGQITDITGSGVAPFSSSLEAGNSPLSSGLFGTFGASLFTGLVTTGSVDYVNSSVLGQSTATGWAIVANAGSDPHVILGLNGEIRSQFTTTVNWTGTSDYQYPITNAAASTEFGGGEFRVRLSGDGVSPVNWVNDTLLDTGTQDNLIHGNPSLHPDLNDYTTNGNNYLEAGYEVGVEAVVVDAEEYRFTTTLGDAVVTHDVQLERDSITRSTIGIGFFLENSVAFDLENQQTLYTDATVIVPEPNAVILFLAGLAVLAVRVSRGGMGTRRG